MADPQATIAELQAKMELLDLERTHLDLEKARLLRQISAFSLVGRHDDTQFGHNARDEFRVVEFEKKYVKLSEEGTFSEAINQHRVAAWMDGISPPVPRPMPVQKSKRHGRWVKKPST
eukprot:TRINITY_DN27599_c0_g1_i1.p2 TRINITY_DN27599_c0_g1~~TRINITY_DN27599_c0_g1_i1.p2  ORF type:complete len:118 (+),score=16.57 TRINITY_DN27599_c0_g1_i1:16-369(+)